jgi:hypothetical protein
VTKFFDVRMSGFAGGLVLVSAVNVREARMKAKALAEKWDATLLSVAPTGGPLAASAAEAVVA